MNLNRDKQVQDHTNTGDNLGESHREPTHASQKVPEVVDTVLNVHKLLLTTFAYSANQTLTILQLRHQDEAHV